MELKDLLGLALSGAALFVSAFFGLIAALMTWRMFHHQTLRDTDAEVAAARAEEAQKHVDAIHDLERQQLLSESENRGVVQALAANHLHGLGELTMAVHENTRRLDNLITLTIQRSGHD